MYEKKCFYIEFSCNHEEGLFLCKYFEITNAKNHRKKNQNSILHYKQPKCACFRQAQR